MPETAHGIVYPSMTDLPDVPFNIGGLDELNESTQTWLADLDSTNLGTLTTLNGDCASTETTVAGVNTGINTAVTRQSGQQTSVTAITSGNANVVGRLNARDTTLTTDTNTVTGFGGQITGMNSTKGRGLVGFSRGSFPSGTHVPGSTTLPFGSVTFNDPAPASNRMYRGSVLVDVSAGTSLTALSSIFLSVGWRSGTTFSASSGDTRAELILWPPLESVKTFNIEVVFTNITWTQWTFWVYSQNFYTSSDYWLGVYGVPSITLEDIGLQL